MKFTISINFETQPKYNAYIPMNWDQLTKQFLSYLRIEKGLSENSCLAYQQDIIKLRDYCLSNTIQPTSITAEHLKAFITILYDLGLSARTQARIISGIKQFFGFYCWNSSFHMTPVNCWSNQKLAGNYLRY